MAHFAPPFPGGLPGRVCSHWMVVVHHFKFRYLVLLVIAAGGLIVIVAFSRARGRDRPIALTRQLWHCGMHPQVIQDHPGDCPICHMALTPINAPAPPGGMSAEPGESAVTIDPVLRQNMGVRTAAVTRGPLLLTVRTVGMLKTPEPGMHEISLKIGGWIDRLYADQEGMHVMAGDALFDLYSPDLQIAEQELMTAVMAKEALTAAASADLRRESQSLIDSSTRKLRLWGVAERDIEAIAKAKGAPPRDIPFRAPVSGHLEDKSVVQGSAVQAGMKLMRIADHSRMWLEAPIYERAFSAVKLGQEMTATIDGMPNRTFKGTISFMYPHVDHMTRTLTVRMTIDNPDFELKPGMYATAEILTRPIENAILAPREAVIDTGVRQIAFVDAGDGHFQPRDVRMGAVGDGDMVQILDGLAPGERVVTSGQFLMDVESRTIEATRKLRGMP
ncbi:MAG TPA: efflux RND transporter periplasmic adaptor subunit [Tepidisphaeraceae bacterium]|nr:efflux RND transporter periplasmic adaptor subunit [Tepidisphaeraceae bacterium]